VEVPRGTAWMLVLVHVHGQEFLNVTIHRPDGTAWHGSDAGSGSRESIVRYAADAPMEGTWHVKGIVEDLATMRAWTVTALLRPG
ncbi:MAG: hypothetical protein LC624_09865, partial [Halobacteriales archaeon]|nr:hypothetical protein [Halobacteriales archaeon]